MTPEELRAALEQIALEEGLLINPAQEHKIPAMAERNRCYCTAERTCPCRERLKELHEHGSCLCRVLVTQEYLDRQAKYKDRPKAKKKPKKRLAKKDKKREKKLRKLGH